MVIWQDAINIMGVNFTLRYSLIHISLRNTIYSFCILADATEKQNQSRDTTSSNFENELSQPVSKERETNNNKETRQHVPPLVRESVIQKTVDTGGRKDTPNDTHPDTIQGCLSSTPQGDLTSTSQSGIASPPQISIASTPLERIASTLHAQKASTHQTDKQSERVSDNSVINLDTSNEEEGSSVQMEKDQEGRDKEKTLAPAGGGKEMTLTQRVIGSFQIDQQDGNFTSFLHILYR